MFNIFRSKKPVESTPATEEKVGFFTRLKQGLSKTRAQFSSSLASLILGRKSIDQDLLEEIESRLLIADVGVDATRAIINELTERLERKELKDPQALLTQLQSLLIDLLTPVTQPLLTEGKPFVILMVGINGAGKTTTIGKLAKYYQQQNKSVMLAAGDTFRAAAVEQLQTWGERNDVAVIAQQAGADSASVIFDALKAAKARSVDILIADTAGRLHTKDNLMEELKKIKRVLQKIEPEAPQEVMLVLDASLGQNGLSQAEQFHKAINVTGITITKLDGTAKGGILFAIAQKLKIPFRFIGVGEKIDDLRPFTAQEYVEALFSDDAQRKDE